MSSSHTLKFVRILLPSGEVTESSRTEPVSILPPASLKNIASFGWRELKLSAFSLICNKAIGLNAIFFDCTSALFVGEDIIFP